MPSLRLTDFHGLAPRFNLRQLPPGRARIADNVRFDSDDLRPYRESAVIQEVASVDAGSLFVYVRGADVVYMPFGHTLDIDLVEGPVVADAFNRSYWTQAGEFMRAINNPPDPGPSGYALPVGAPNAFRPFKGYIVGVAPPNLTPGALNISVDKEVGFGTGITIEGFASEKPVRVSTSAAHGFENGERVVIVVDSSLAKPPPAGEGSGGETTGPPPSEDPGAKTIAPADLRIWDFDGHEFIVGNVSATGDQFDLNFADASGYGNFPKADLEKVTIRRVIDENDLNSISYVFTYVSVHGEEGPPSPASDFIDILDDGTAQITLQDDGLLTEGQPELIDRVRIYRTVTGSTGTNFQLVGTLPFNGGASPDADGLSWSTAPNQSSPALAWTGVAVDAVPPVELGEILPSEGWFPPPKGLAGLTLMPNGYFVAFKGRDLYFSEAYLPHAWPPENRKVVDFEIVGLAASGGRLVVGTRGRPYLGSGTDPASFTLDKANLHAPLLHKRAMIDVGIGVAYPSTDGLALIGRGGAQYVTKHLYDKKTWKAATDGRDQAVFHDERYMLYGRDKTVLVFDLNDPKDGVEVSVYTELIGAAAQQDDELIIVGQAGAGDYRELRRFNDNDSDQLEGVWRSGLYTLPRAINWAVAQVFAEGYPLTLKILYPDPLRFGVDAAGEYDLDEDDLKTVTFTVNGAEPFTLPSDYLAREFVIELVSQHRVQMVHLASNWDEIRRG